MQGIVCLESWETFIVTYYIHCKLIRYFVTYFLFVQVLPSLMEKHGEFLLRELVQRWANHKIMVRWLARFFHYLDRSFISRRSLTPLKEVGLTSFIDLVKGTVAWVPYSVLCYCKISRSNCFNLQTGIPRYQRAGERYSIRPGMSLYHNEISCILVCYHVTYFYYVFFQ